MSAALGLFRRLFARGAPRGSLALDGFVDSLLQKFENCRPGLTDETIEKGPAAVEKFFTDLYEVELPRLRETVRLQEPLLSLEAREEFVERVDELVRKVVIPGYVRVAAGYTRRERNDFYAMPEAWHVAERILYAVLGVGLSILAIEIPQIPIYAKEWVIPFMLGGLVYPELRRYVWTRHYENQLNQLVARSDSEIGRIDMAYLTDGESLQSRGSLDSSEPARRAAARAAETERGGNG
jgi:hypothetical protein